MDFMIVSMCDSEKSELVEAYLSPGSLPRLLLKKLVFGFEFDSNTRCLSLISTTVGTGKLSDLLLRVEFKWLLALFCFWVPTRNSSTLLLFSLGSWDSGNFWTFFLGFRHICSLFKYNDQKSISMLVFTGVRLIKLFLRFPFVLIVLVCFLMYVENTALCWLFSRGTASFSLKTLKFYQRDQDLLFIGTWGVGRCTCGRWRFTRGQFWIWGCITLVS